MQANRPDSGAVEYADVAKVTTFRLPSTVRDKFKQILFLRGDTMQELMTATVESYIKDNEYLLDRTIRKKKPKRAVATDTPSFLK